VTSVVLPGSGSNAGRDTALKHWARCPPNNDPTTYAVRIRSALKDRRNPGDQFSHAQREAVAGPARAGRRRLKLSADEAERGE
jgi:hypothetical protein